MNRDDREPGECSRTPSPQSSHITYKNVRSRRNTSRYVTHREENQMMQRDESLIELIDLDGEGQESEVIEASDDDEQFLDTSGLFVLDTCGAEIIEVDEKGEILSTVRSSQIEEHRKSDVAENEIFDMTKILTNDAVPDSPSEEKKESAFKMCCFNCCGEHNLQQCDVPLNHQRIADNRADYYNKKRAIQERYTTVKGNDKNDKDDIRPGEISDALREALDIGPNDIPEWIYRMRQKGFINGYPPGYLAEVLDEDSNELLIFHTDDETLVAPHNSDEENNDERKPPTVSADKIIVYPGFNYYDRSLKDREHFRVPRFDEYVRYIQEYANMKFTERLSCKREHSRGKRKKGNDKNNSKNELKRRKSDTDDSVIFVEEVPSANEVVAESNAERSVTPLLCQSVASSSCVTPVLHPQDSIISFGTPVMFREEHDKQKPSLENFRENILPFKAVEEDTVNRGFFTALMAKIRGKK